jgi:hypothetical protein
MTVETLPDTEGAIRAYLRTATEVTSSAIGTRVFFGVPKPHKETNFPLAVVTRVGGGPDSSDAPIDQAVIQIDVHGTFTEGQYGDKRGCRAAANAILRALRFLDNANGAVVAVDGVNVALHGAIVSNDLWLPDTDNDRPRYVITAAVTAIVV